MMSESKMQLQGRLSENVIYPKRFPLLPTADKDITGPALPLTFDVLWSEICSFFDIQSSSKFIRNTCKTQSFWFLPTDKKSVRGRWPEPEASFYES